ncbi:hypothetical protein F5Y18DRAFT_53446 [Xylariaceae sp. FL1019]|nr:hypothetical protein F5Y18DRAFT_53446 [Xylariaceae sp. FL1019]
MSLSREESAGEKRAGVTVDQPTADLSKVLTDFMSSGSNSTFTCGGAIPLADLSTAVPSAVVVRWDRPDGSQAKVAFPVADDDAIAAAALDTLAGDCQPAGFGHRGKTVLDDSVRRAGAMDCARFSSNLCPYTLGIVDRVTQLLLPNVAGMLPTDVPSVGFVRAELCKLNIYEGPSGFFKKHVDTPRAESQFGSLVLCLPSAHEGGRLTVRHGGLEPVTHDWDGAATAGDVLQWAAFYSDCEHEVHEVTAGRRVTVTYNLYYERRVSANPMAGLDSKPAPVDVTKLAPYATMRDLLQNPEWMKDGQTLGIYCAHAYPTTTSKLVNLDGYSGGPAEPLASDKVTTLKGTDMSLYAVFRQLGLEVRLVPIITSLEDLSDDRLSGYRYPTKRFWPRGGTNIKPGEVGMTELGTYEEDIAKVPRAFGDRMKHVEWITEPLWRNLALIHGNHLGNDAGPPGVAYAYNAMIVTIPAAASRGDLVSSA